MRILITGMAGFVGSHVCEELLKNTDHEIVALDSLNYSGNLNRLTDMDCWDKEKHRVRFVYHDLRAPISETIANMIGDIDQIWHLAAESHVDRAIKDPIPFWESNVLGTVNLLNYAKSLKDRVFPVGDDESFYNGKLDRFIYFSTDEVFGPAPEGVYHTEGDTHNPSNDYSASKSAAEMACKAAAFTHGLPVTITRSMNIYGPRQHIEKFIPTKIKQALENGKITLHGLNRKITPSRCWIHGRAVASALCFIAEHGEIIQKSHQDDADYGVYHIVGPEYDTYDLAARIFKIVTGRDVTEDDIEYQDYHSQRPGHDLRYAMSGKKLEALGWKDKQGFWESFDKTISWMLDHKEWL